VTPGTIVKRGPTYSVVLDLGRGPDGCRIRKWHSGYRTRKDAERARVELLTTLDRGSYVEPSKLTVAAFLRDHWLPGLRAQVRPGTRAEHHSKVEVHLVPAIGGVLLQRLTPGHLNAVYADLLEQGLSGRTVLHVHATIRRSLADATRWGPVPRNVALLASPPRPGRPELQVWTAADLRSFLAFVEDDRLHALWLLAASAGMRRGEVLGVQARRRPRPGPGRGPPVAGHGRPGRSLERWLLWYPRSRPATRSRSPAERCPAHPSAPVPTQSCGGRARAEWPAAPAAA
jgi:Arm DNA-binding domain